MQAKGERRRFKPHGIKEPDECARPFYRKSDLLSARLLKWHLQLFTIFSLLFPSLSLDPAAVCTHTREDTKGEPCQFSRLELLRDSGLEKRSSSPRRRCKKVQARGIRQNFPFVAKRHVHTCTAAEERDQLISCFYKRDQPRPLCFSRYFSNFLCGKAWLQPSIRTELTDRTLISFRPRFFSMAEIFSILKQIRTVFSTDFSFIFFSFQLFQWLCILKKGMVIYRRKKYLLFLEKKKHCTALYSSYSRLLRNMK